MTNIFINNSKFKLDKLHGKARCDKLKSIAASYNITQTKCNAMYRDYLRINTLQDRIVKYASKVW